MVIRRPKKNPDAQGDDPKPDVELMEHLVKKSLDINPALRRGQDTETALAEIRKQASKRPTSAEDKPGVNSDSETDSSALANRRQGAIVFFLEQKESEFKSHVAEILEKERALADERRKLREQLINDIADFLGLMAGGAESPEAKKALRDSMPFLSSVGVKPGDIVDRIHRRSERR